MQINTDKKKIGIIGYGNMGSAIAEQLKSAYQIQVFDKDNNKTKDISGIAVAKNILNLVKGVEVIVLAVKPQDFDALLTQIKPGFKNQLLISIAAGISTGYIEKKLGHIRLVRAMPNLPAKIGKGMICLCKGKDATLDDLKLARELFDYLGTVLEIQERMMDVATAVSGSGPGFFYCLIQNKKEQERLDFAQRMFAVKLSQAALRLGFKPEEAKQLALVTTLGSLALLRVSKASPEDLCAQVASKGGTTEAGLKVLENNIDYLEKAVLAAKKRSQELAK